MHSLITFHNYTHNIGYLQHITFLHLSAKFDLELNENCKSYTFFNHTLGSKTRLLCKSLIQDVSRLLKSFKI